MAKKCNIKRKRLPKKQFGGQLLHGDMATSGTTGQIAGAVSNIGSQFINPMNPDGTIQKGSATAKGFLQGFGSTGRCAKILFN